MGRDAGTRSTRLRAGGADEETAMGTALGPIHASNILSGVFADVVAIQDMKLPYLLQRNGGKDSDW